MRAGTRRFARRHAGVLVLSVLATGVAGALYRSDPVGGLWHTYFNPALEGAPAGFTPDGVQNYGETAVDELPLVDWAVGLPGEPPPEDCGTPTVIEKFFGPFLSAPHGTWLGSMLLKDDGMGNIVENPFLTQADFQAVFSIPWQIPDDSASFTREYRARHVVLPSGARFAVFAPGSGDDTSWQLEENSPCAGFDQDVMYFLLGTHGHGWKSNPLAWFELEDVNTAPLVTGDLGSTLSWHRQKSMAVEALSMGMTLVIPEWNVGRRPFAWSMAQLAEFDQYLNSPEYVNEFTTTPDGDVEVTHRSFAYGGSYGGAIATWVAMYYDWMLHGAIAVGINPDYRQMWAWGETYYAMARYMSVSFSDYNGLARQPYMNLHINTLLRGFGGPEVGLDGRPVDLMGLSVYGTEVGLENLSTLQMPLIVVTGEEDASSYSFWDQDASAVSPLARRLTVPLMAHPDIGLLDAWNAGEQVVHQMVAMAGAGGCDALPGSPAEIDWVPQLPQGQDRDSEEFMDEFLRVNALVTQPPTTPVEVERVTSGEWLERRVPEGLGMGGTTLLEDLDNDGVPELFSTTASGQMGSLTFDLDPNGFVQDVRRLFGTRVAPWLGASELVRLENEPRFATVHRYGIVAEIEVDPGSADPISVDFVLGEAQVGRGLHSFHALGGGRFVVVNDLGEVVVLTRSAGSPGTWGVESRTYIEGGISQLLPIGGDEAVFTSPSGFLKRLQLGMGHPTEPNHVGSFETGDVELFERLEGGGPAHSQYIGVVVGEADWSLALYNANLQRVRTLYECVGSVPQVLEVAFNGLGRLGLLTGWQTLPAASGRKLPGIVAMLPKVGTPNWKKAIPQLHTPPPPPTGGLDGPALRALLLKLMRFLDIRPSLLANESPTFVAPPTTEPDDDEEVFGDILGPRPRLGAMTSGNNGNNNPGCDIEDIELRHIATDAQPGTITRVPAAHVMYGVSDTDGVAFRVRWVSLLHSGQVVLIGNAFRKNPRYQIVGEALTASFGVVGLSDTRARVVTSERTVVELDVDDGSIVAELPNDTAAGVYVETGRPAHFGLESANGCNFGMYDGADLWVPGPGNTGFLAYAGRETTPDPDSNWAGLKVIQVDLVGCTWDYHDPLSVFESELLFSPSTGNLPGTGGADQGNAIEWVDLDQDGQMDLVMGTFGGVVHWFRNTSGNPLTFSAAPQPTASSADLGTRIVALDVTDADGDGLPELVVGTGTSNHPTIASELSPKGEIHVLRLAGNTLGSLVSASVGLGVYGIHAVSDPFARGKDLICATTANGRLHLYELEIGSILPVVSLEHIYSTRTTAPLLGAFDAMQTFPIPGGTPGLRLVAGSGGGVLAFDITPTGPGSIDVGDLPLEDAPPAPGKRRPVVAKPR